MVVASETCALDLLGATIACELQPGRVRPDRGRRGHRAAPARAPAGEPLRLRAGVLRPARQHRLRRVGRPGPPRARPAAGARAAGARRARWCSACPTAPTPWRSASPRSPGIKLEYGLIRNHYVGRTFINPTQALRVAKVKIKFNPVRDVIAGQVGGGRGRQPGPRQHQQGPGADDPGRRRARGASPARLAADHRAVPLRHRHADPRGAHRRDPLGRGDPRVPRRRLARLPLARRHAPRGGPRAPSSATPASPASTRRRSRTSWCSSGTPPRSSRRPHERPLHASPWSTSSARDAPTAPPP